SVFLFNKAQFVVYGRIRRPIYFFLPSAVLTANCTISGLNFLRYNVFLLTICGFALVFGFEGRYNLTCIKV
ncbi:MAG: hypothetical protein LIO52_06815, partial [Oscillospiraceae bacterium]|nr:hypothetical protein [Oscillospiraceae bacterium]